MNYHIKNYISRIIKKILIEIQTKFFEKSRKERLLKNSIEFFEKSEEKEIQDIGKEMKNNKCLQIFFGEWKEKYQRLEIKFGKDIVETGELYVIHARNNESEKKIYFPSSWADNDCLRYYRSVMLEQDDMSPHCYIKSSEMDHIDFDGTVLDIGTAEGIFTLDVVDKAKQIFCFEPDNKWLEALKKTLEPYAYKCKLINKYISSNEDRNGISIDNFFGEKIPTDIKIIKMDIEGYEYKALLGMERTLRYNPKALLLVCVYHTQNAENMIKKLMPKGYIVEHREGYMLFYLDRFIKKPYLRHGVLRIRRGLGNV